MNDDDALIPKSFVDPITQDVLVDPVVTADGHSYSRGAIERWLASHNTSPMTGAVLAHKHLSPNHALRSAIEEWRARRPKELDPMRLTLTTTLLGEGSFGRVVAGTLAVGGTRPPLAVAVKMLPALTREEELRVFARELRAHIHAAQNCDGVCVLHGTCDKEQRMCIVMKRYECSLSDVIARAGGPLDAAVARRYGQSLFRTLRQLHEMVPALIVQDIKPQNVLVDAHDELVLSDFGISEVVRTSTNIMPSSIKGTFNYMSPEAFDPEAAGGIGPPADVWSMGCVVVEMLTGTAPWAAMPIQQIMTAVLVRRRTPDVPEVAPSAAVIRRCFAHAPHERPTASEMERALAPPRTAVVPPRELPDEVTALGAQVERLSVQKTVALEDLREAHEQLAWLTQSQNQLRTEVEQLRSNEAQGRRVIEQLTSERDDLRTQVEERDATIREQSNAQDNLRRAARSV